jgi:glycosyltransferase involved in cell wall biosynthesis
VKGEAGPVVHLSTARGWRGGERQALLLAEGLQARGVPTLVLAQPESPMAEAARAAGLPSETLPSRGEWDLLAMIRLAATLRRCRASLLHAHDGHAVTLAAFGARWGGGVPRLCTRRVDFPVRGGWKYRRGMDRVICISEAIRRICLESGVPEAKTALVPSGIDLAAARAATRSREVVREELTGGERRLLLLTAASLTDHKGHRYLLDAMPRVAAELPQALLLLVGTGELEGGLKAQANTLALEEHVRFLGWRDDLPDLMQAADLFVMPSHLEGLCTAAMDAQAAGLPVVATTAGGLPEVVADGVTGRLVPPRDPEALAGAILELLRDRKARARMARAAAEAAARRFDKARMVEGTLRVYGELTGPSGPAGRPPGAGLAWRPGPGRLEATEPRIPRRGDDACACS